jgi:hypothetical protein
MRRSYSGVLGISLILALALAKQVLRSKCSIEALQIQILLYRF